MRLSAELREYLQKWFSTSTAKKRKDGIQVDLTFKQFVGLFEKRQLTSLQKSIDGKCLFRVQREDNPLAYVLTWRSYTACSSGVFSEATATVCSRLKSAAINKPQPGDKLRPSHCENISTSLTGVAKTEEHCANISAAKKGRQIAPWTPARKKARSEQRRAREAAKRAATV